MVFLEKRALKGVLSPIVVDRWGLNIYSCNGQLSESLLYRCGVDIKNRGKPTYAYVLSDFDPAGNSDLSGYRGRDQEKARRVIAHFTGGIPVYVEHLALTHRQVKEWNLPTRATKSGRQKIPKILCQARRHIG